MLLRTRKPSTKLVELTGKTEESRFTLADIFGTMREGILILNDRMSITVANAAAQDILANSLNVVEGRRLSEVIRDFPLHEAFEHAISKDKRSEVRIELVGASRRIFDVVVSPLKLDTDYAAIGVFYEVTRIERLERVRQEFLSNISHELRTPLTSILTFVETLSDGAIEDAENSGRFLDVIRKNAQRMHVLIDDISELSSIEAGQVKIRPENIRLNRFVEDVFINFESTASEYKVTLLNEVPEDEKVFADNLRLEQMLTNLVDNAIKFNREGGEVRVGHRVEDSFAIISVSDTGEGIRKEQQARIFERFYRVDKARSREVGGTGLGLAIVKHLARLHGGNVSVDSAVGVGTRFDISFPKY